jgi:hypothetical protein
MEWTKIIGRVVKVKVKPSLYSRGKALRVQEAVDTRFHDNRYMKVVRLSALGIGRFSPKRYPWYSFLLED